MDSSSKSLKGKVALVTGSSRGIGRAIAERYGSLGASVVVNYAGDERTARDVVAAIERSGGAAIAVKADVSKVPEIDHLYQAALDKFGRLDIAVANAGVELVNQPIRDVTEQDFDRLFAINTKGAFDPKRSSTKRRSGGSQSSAVFFLPPYLHIQTLQVQYCT